jgi:hypothetical protein
LEPNPASTLLLDSRSVEHEALRRAGDQPGTSVLAEETALFTIAYQNWLRILLNWENAQVGIEFSQYSRYLRRSVLIRSILSETLLALERKAAAVEARALDLRLRFDHDRILDQLAGREVASALVRIVGEAASNQETREHFESVARRLAELETSIAPKVARIEREMTFVADHVTTEVAKQFKAPPAEVLEFLSKQATGAGLKAVFTMILRSSASQNVAGP